MKYKTTKRIGIIAFTSMILFNTCFSQILTVNATNDREAAQLERQQEPVQSNSYKNWPDGPVVSSQSAILMELNTGTILYAKNIDEKLYPASTTKILTAYIAAQKAKMDETVTFSEKSIYSIDWRNDANMGIKVGDQITMEQALYGVLVGSANEAAYTVAEHISGSVEEFAKLMNETSKELGCKNSNWVTPNGIHDENHYTTAYDLAIIAQAFFSNETLAKMSSTPSYQIPQTATQMNPEMIVHSKNQLFPNKKYRYENLVGSKTGYTNEARQTLVSCARKDGMTLIAVVLKDESPNQYLDTISLFDYGFSNFKAFNISQNETKYTIDNSDFFDANKDVFGSSKPILSLDNTDYIVLPNNCEFIDATSSLSYDANNNNSVAKINYMFNDILVGSASINILSSLEQPYDFEDEEETLSNDKPVEEKESNKVSNSENIVFINVKVVIFSIIGIAILLGLIFVLRSVLNNYHFARRRKSKISRKKRRKIRSEFDKFNF